jgi:hypothetical protein
MDIIDYIVVTIAIGYVVGVVAYAIKEFYFEGA